jgi:hypothetical protein
MPDPTYRMQQNSWPWTHAGEPRRSGRSGRRPHGRAGRWVRFGRKTPADERGAHR